MGKRWWLGAAVLAAASAAAAYFLDPQNGKARRIRVVERSSHLARIAEHRARRQARYIEHTVRGRGEQRVASTRQRLARRHFDTVDRKRLAASQ